MANDEFEKALKDWLDDYDQGAAMVPSRLEVARWARGYWDEAIVNQQVCMNQFIEENKKFRTENQRLREALEKIKNKIEECDAWWLDGFMTDENAELNYAEQALAETEGE